jgi:hypothetical protein
MAGGLVRNLVALIAAAACSPGGTAWEVTAKTRFARFPLLGRETVRSSSRPQSFNLYATIMEDGGSMKQIAFRCGLLLLAVWPALADDAKVKAAQEAADSWLALVDAGRYGESWDEAASVFRDRVPREQWESMCQSVRHPLGDLKSRSRSSAQYTQQLPGVPDGEYVVIQYRASYEKKKSAVETVTPMRDSDGKWRVSGYFIR